MNYCEYPQGLSKDGHNGSNERKRRDDRTNSLNPRPTTEGGLTRLFRRTLQEPTSAYVSDPRPDLSLLAKEGRVGKTEDVRVRSFKSDVGRKDGFGA